MYSEAPPTAPTDPAAKARSTNRCPSVFSPAIAGQTPLRPAVQREYFGRSAFGTIQGLLTIGMIAASVIGLPLAGWIFDIRGSYFLAWFIFALAAAAAVPLALMMKSPPPRALSAENQV